MGGTDDFGFDDKWLDQLVSDDDNSSGMEVTNLGWYVTVHKSSGRTETMLKSRAVAYIAKVLDEQAFYWSLSGVEPSDPDDRLDRFTTLRAAVLYVYGGQWWSAGLNLVDLVLALTNANIIYGTGIPINRVEMPELWDEITAGLSCPIL